MSPMWASGTPLGIGSKSSHCHFSGLLNGSITSGLTVETLNRPSVNSLCATFSTGTLSFLICSERLCILWLRVAPTNFMSSFSDDHHKMFLPS